MSPYLLSICIPTYNRLNKLQNCLEKLLEQYQFYSQQIELIILDHGSNDNTFEYLKIINQKFPIIKILRIDENIGDEVFFYLSKLCRGAFFWILGDDRLICPNALKNILLKLSNPNLNLLFCNFILETSKNTVHLPYYSIRKKIFYTNHNELLKTHNIHLGHVSDVIIRVDIFRTVPKEIYSKYHQFGWAFLFTIYHSLKGILFCEIIQEAVYFKLKKNFPYYPWINFFVIGPSKVLNDLQILGYSPYAVYKAKNQVLKEYTLWQIYTSKIQGDFSFSKIISLMFRFYPYCYNFWGLCLPMCFIPTRAIRFYKYLKS